MKTVGLLFLLGAFHLGHHVPRYWWQVSDNCTIGAIAKGNTIYVGTKPGVYCVQVPGHWSTIPPPNPI